MTGLTKSKNDFKIQFDNNLKTLKNKKERNFSFLPPLLGFWPVGPTPVARAPFFLSSLSSHSRAGPNQSLTTAGPNLLLPQSR
jgi:hypothetical protein